MLEFIAMYVFNLARKKKTMKKFFSTLTIAFTLSIQVFIAQISYTKIQTSTKLPLRGISFSDTLNGYICGDNGLIMKTTDGGKSWANQNSGTNQNLWDIQVIPNTNGQQVLSIGNNKTVRKTVNGGVSWSNIQVPFGNGSFLFGIHCIDSLTYYLSGGDFQVNSGAVLETKNGGVTWKKYAQLNSVFMDKVFMLDTNLGFVCGTGNSFNNGSIFKLDKAMSPDFQLSLFSNNLVISITGRTKNHIVAVGNFGRIWNSKDMGQNWTESFISDTLNSSLFSVKFADTLNGIMCGGISDGSFIQSTIDGGNTWKEEIHPKFLGSLLAISIQQNKIFMSGDSGIIIIGEFPKLQPPTIRKVKLNNLTPLSARISAEVNANKSSTSTWIEYGLEAYTYDSVIKVTPFIVNGLNYTAINHTISNLKPNTLYHYRLKSSNVAGVTYTEDSVFKTPSASSIKNLSHMVYSIFPNPSKGKLNIWVEEDNISFDIFDLSGKFIRSYTLRHGKNIIDLDNISSGNYISILNHSSGEIETRIKIE